MIKVSINTPKFEYPDESAVFQVGDEIYVISDNEYDIYEEIIEEITSDGTCKVYYPDSEENEDISDFYRLLFRTAKNISIFQKQEKIR